MREPQFEYGLLAKGIFHALIALAPVVFFIWPQWLLWYAALLIFLVVGLRPLLERTGLYELFHFLVRSTDEQLHKKEMEQRVREIDRKERDKKYKHTHRRDPKLPKNW